jgi:hypothetical protein
MDTINIIETKNKRTLIKDGKIVYKSGKEDTLEYGISEIAEQAYMANDDIIRAVLPDSVEKICDSAFFHCQNLESVTLPETLTEIGFSAFSHCSVLKSIELPFGITKIPSFGFSCTPLEEISVPDGVEEIDSYAFFHCTELKKIILPASLKIIDDSAFKDCLMLSEVYYAGSRQDFHMIYINGVGFISPENIFGTAKIHYSGEAESVAQEKTSEPTPAKSGIFGAIKNILRKK